MDTVVVYKANLDSVQPVLRLLRKEGFNPVTLDDPNPSMPHYLGQAYPSVRDACLISIAVPREEAPGAASVLRKWDKSRRTSVQETTKNLSRSLWYSSVIVAIIALILLLFGVLSDAAALLFLAWLALFALFANLDRLGLRRRGTKAKDPQRRYR